MNSKIAVVAVIGATALLAACGHIPEGAERINMITRAEAEANNCQLLDKAGSVSAILINGSKRNTQVAVKKALRVPGATHVGYTKGKPGTTNVRMFRTSFLRLGKNTTKRQMPACPSRKYSPIFHCLVIHYR